MDRAPRSFLAEKFLAAFFKKRAGCRGKAPARIPQDAKPLHQLFQGRNIQPVKLPEEGQ